MAKKKNFLPLYILIVVQLRPTIKKDINQFYDPACSILHNCFFFRQITAKIWVKTNYIVQTYQSFQNVRHLNYFLQRIFNDFFFIFQIFITVYVIAPKPFFFSSITRIKAKVYTQLQRPKKKNVFHRIVHTFFLFEIS